MRAVKTLPTRANLRDVYKLLLRHRRLEGRSIADIAAHLGLSASHVAMAHEMVVTAGWCCLSTSHDLRQRSFWLTERGRRAWRGYAFAAARTQVRQLGRLRGGAKEVRILGMRQVGEDPNHQVLLVRYSSNPLVGYGVHHYDVEEGRITTSAYQPGEMAAHKVWCAA